MGQRRVLLVAVWIFAASLLLMAFSVEAGWARAVTYAAAAVAGATMPTVGACVRARWSHVLDRPADVQTAYALESVLDEVVFITGPILVTVLATAWHPLAGLATAVAAALIGTLAFAAQRSTEPPAQRHRDGLASAHPMPWRAMLTIALVCIALGTLFGAAEVATVALRGGAGQQAVGRLPPGPLVGRQPDRRGRHRGGPVAARAGGPAAVRDARHGGRDEPRCRSSARCR